MGASQITGIIAIVAIVFVVQFLVVMKVRRAKRALGLKLLQAIRMLIKHVQVHRGLMAAFFGGRLDVNKGIAFSANTISADLDNIIKIDQAFAENENLLGISSHWAKLSASGSRQNVYDNYEQHCKLVSSSLELMLWASKHYALKTKNRAGGSIYWHELLLIGEALGQLRALGLICLSSPQDSEVKSRCISKIKRCVEDIEILFESKSLQAKIGKLNCNEIRAFIDMVTYRIIQNKSWITEEQYFSQATETIEIIYKCFDEEMQRMYWLN